MKKIAIFSLALMLAFSFLLIKAPQSALAIGSGIWVLPLAGSSTAFTSVNIDEAAKTAHPWLQQLSDGVQIDVPTEICYPFRGGQFHWVPQILELNNGTWSEVETTTEYLYGAEATQYACAVPVAAGTFALFGYYNGPVETFNVNPVGDKLFTVDHWAGSFATRIGGYDVTNLIAYSVNWDGYYPTAKKLAWGSRMCWDSVCHEYADGTLSINASLFPYPQNKDVTVIGESSYFIYTAEIGHTCEFKPFVKLLDSSNHVLDVIYYTDYGDYCVS